MSELQNLDSTVESRPVILTFVRCYLPGYKSGGPIRSISNLVDRLSQEFRFKIVTSDRDSGDTEQYSDIEPEVWTRVGNAEVYYLPPSKRTLGTVLRILRETPHDLIYLNSLFNYVFTILPLIAHRMKDADSGPIILAPRGELSPGALAIKSRKKKVFLVLAGITGLYRRVHWQSTSAEEEKDIHSNFGLDIEIDTASNIGQRLSRIQDLRNSKNERLRLVFLSRLVPKKNLAGAIRMLMEVTVPVQFTVYGTYEDEQYLTQCRKLAANLPINIEVDIRGPIPHEKVMETLAQHDVFYFPTHGENYGHVIAEALLAGCPVLISDQTPFRDLETKGVGWDIPLDQPEQFRDTIERIARMDADEFSMITEQTLKFGRELAENQESVEAHRRMFQRVLTMSGNEAGRLGG